ncbi:Mitotic spindle-associated MMXD complex subunit MIP18, partial [Kappamyces sp. JEL0829]
MATLINENPIIYHSKSHSTKLETTLEDWDDDIPEELTVEEVWQLIRNINDPEHPLSLEQLNVAQKELIQINGNHVNLTFTPTIPHCSMATLIGLCIRVQLLRTLPARFKVDINVTPGTHQSEQQVNKQLNDKER